MNDSSIRPEPREVMKTSFHDFKVITLEQPDLMVQHPYQVIVVSTCEALGIGTTVLSFRTLVGANGQHAEQVNRYVAYRRQINSGTLVFPYPDVIDVIS